MGGWKRVKRFISRLGMVLITLVFILLTGSAAALVAVGFVSVDEAHSEQVSRQTASEPGTTAFTRIDVLPMTGDQHILEDYTVIVEGNRITSVGPSAHIIVPEDATIIDGRGFYLLPGLTDAHVHIKDQDELLLYIAAGVTSVRDLWGTTGSQLAMGFPDQLRMQERIAEGTLLGPTIYPAGPIMEGAGATNPLLPTYTSREDAVESVRWQAEQGYHYIKVYDHLPLDLYTAITAEAAHHNLPVVGHVPHAVGIERAIAHEQHSIEHLTGLVDSEAAALLVPESDLNQVAHQIAEAGIWMCPTLVLYTRVLPDAELDALQAQPEMRYVPLWLQHIWPFFTRQIRADLTYTGEDYAVAIEEVNTQAMQALHRANARFIVGTDTDNPFLVPGFVIYDEMEAMVRAGLTPYEVLQAATVNAAEALGASGVFGTVAADQRADLIMLRANPLEDISHIRAQEGVMVRGQWFTEGELTTMLDGLAESYHPTLVDWLPVGGLGGVTVLSAVLTITLFRRRDQTTEREAMQRTYHEVSF